MKEMREKACEPLESAKGWHKLAQMKSEGRGLSSEIITYGGKKKDNEIFLITKC